MLLEPTLLLVRSVLRSAVCLATLAVALWTSSAGALPFAYVPINGGAAIAVFDTATDTLVTTIPIIASRAVVNSTGTRVYTTTGAPAPGGVPTRIEVIDTATNTVIATLPLTGFNQVSALAISADDRRLYFGEFTSTPGPGRPFNSVGVIDTATNTRLGNTDVGPAGVFSFVRAILSDPLGTRTFAAVGSDANNLITTLDRRCDEVSGSFSLGSGSFNTLGNVVIHPNGTRIYALDSRSLIVSDAGGALLATLPFNGAFNLAISPAGDRLFVSSFNDNTLYAIDTATNTIATSVFVPGRPGGVLMHPNGTKLYLQQVTPNNIAVIAPGNLSTLGTFSLGGSVSLLPGQIPSGVTGPGPVDVPPPANVSITGIEVTQGIQALDNHVRLVRGRKTFARVYVKTDGPTVPNVTAALSGQAIGFSGGGTVTFPLGSIAPVNPRPITALSFMPRFDLNSSFLFELPWSWTANNGLRVGATLGAGGVAPGAALCPRDLATKQTLELGTPARIRPVFVRLGYTLPGIPNRVETTLPERDRSVSFMERTYPVSNLDWRDYEVFDANLGPRVTQNALECFLLDPDERNLCARNYISNALADLQSETGFMGDADVAYALIPQHPADGRDNIYFTRGACCTERVGGGPADDATYASHEIGHFLGRDHPVQGALSCEHSATDPAYPYLLAHIAPVLPGEGDLEPQTALAGFDKGDTALGFVQRFIPGLIFHDFMSYCGNYWVSDYTWGGLYAAMLALSDIRDAGSGIGGAVINPGPSGEPQPAPGDWLSAFGTVAGDGTSASFTSVKRLPSIVLQPARTPGALALRFADSGGAVLASYPFTPQLVEGGPAPPVQSTPDISTFGVIVPFAAGTRAIQIVNTSLPGSPVVGSAAVSANAPVVSSAALRSPPDPQTGIAVLEWSASDADGDALTFDVRLVREDGSPIAPLQLALGAREANVGTSALAGGTVRLEVVAFDGVLRGSARTAPFTIAPKPPQPRILAPGDGHVAYVGSTLNLEGEALDAKDGRVADAGLAWSTESGAIGTGPRISLAGLAVGPHTLTLTATNTAGLDAASSIQIEVRNVPSTTAPLLVAGPTPLAWHVAPGETVLQTIDVTVANGGDGTPLAFSVAESAPWLTVSALNGTTPATIALTADPAGFTSGATEETVVTFTSDAGSVQIPVTLAAGDTFSRASDAAPAVTPPADLTVAATEPGGARSFASAELAAFLAAGSADDAVDPAPQRLTPFVGDVPIDPQTLFAVGPTVVTFRFADASGNVGTAIAQVTVSPFQGAAACEVDGNGQIDRDDVESIFGARGATANAGDPRDADADGAITVLDVSLCRAQCTHANCRTSPPLPACGVGAELALAFAAIGVLRRRTRKALGRMLCATALAGAVLLGAARAESASLGLSPASQSIATNGAVAVDVVISGLGVGAAPTLAAFDLDITFDASVLSFVSVDFGAELGIPGLDALVSSGLLAGPVRIDLAEASLLANATLDANQPESFVLATLHFLALAPGTASLAITQAVLADTAGGPGNNQIPATVSGASVTVIPEPGTLVLLLIGIALLGRRP